MNCGYPQYRRYPCRLAGFNSMAARACNVPFLGIPLCTPRSAISAAPQTPRTPNRGFPNQGGPPYFLPTRLLGATSYTKRSCDRSTLAVTTLAFVRTWVGVNIMTTNQKTRPMTNPAAAPVNGFPNNVPTAAPAQAKLATPHQTTAQGGRNALGAVKR